MTLQTGQRRKAPPFFHWLRRIGAASLLLALVGGCSTNSSEPASGPPAPELISPADGAVLSANGVVTLAWSALAAAGQYSVEIAAAADFAELEAAYTVKATTTEVSDLGPGRHHWRVRGAGSPGQEFGWSAVWSFELVVGR